METRLKAVKRMFVGALALVLPLIWATSVAVASSQEGDADYGDYLKPLGEREVELHAMWQAFLRDEAGGDVARLSELLGSRRPAYFDDSCARPTEPGDAERLRGAIAAVLMTGLTAPASARAEPDGRGRFLACLRRSGAGNLAARMELAVQRGWMSQFRDVRPMRCLWAPQGDMPAYAELTREQITWHSPSSFVAGKAAGVQGLLSGQSFANVWFHESMHIAGIRGHRIVFPALACCGDIVQDRAAACAALDRVVMREIRMMHLSGPLGREGLLGPAQALFPAKDLTALAIDLYGSMTEHLDGLIEPTERAACVRADGQRACSTRLLVMTRAAVDQTLGARCPELVTGESEAACRLVDAKMRGRIAEDAVATLMQTL